MKLMWFCRYVCVGSLAKLPDGIAASTTILFDQAAYGDLNLILAPQAHGLEAPRVTSHVEERQWGQDEAHTKEHEDLVRVVSIGKKAH